MRTKRTLTKPEIAAVCADLQALRRQQSWHLKSRIMIANRLQATVAGTIGYHAGLPEKQRATVFGEASKLIEQIVAGETTTDLNALVLTTATAIRGFDDQAKLHERSMVALAKTLPILAWVEHPDQAGFGVKSLAVVIGECGDLSNYANPAKVWRRMACAPFTKQDETHMGKTWRLRASKPNVLKLSAADWETYGYSPRRRSVSYIIGENLLKTNKGDYRQRYDDSKALWLADHPEEEKPGHAHLHGMLLATKLLLKRLWVEWNGNPPHPPVHYHRPETALV